MILLIDCSQGLHLIIGNKKKILVKSYKPRLKKVSEALVLEIENLLNIISKNYKDLSKIIVINGPGSFTGIRTSVTVAKVLGLSLNIPVCGISLFDVISTLHLKTKSKKKQKILIHMNNHKYFMQDISLLGKKNKIEIINFEYDLFKNDNKCDIISSNNKIKSSLRIVSKLNLKNDIYIYCNIFSATYKNLINLSENQYIPGPIYVKTY